MYKKFVFSFVLILLFFGPIGQFFVFKFTNLYDLNLKTKLYDSARWVRGEPKIAIMGTSHAKYQIIPEEMVKLNPEYKNGDIVNIAEDAASPFAMYHTYMKHKEKFKNLQYVFYTLEPHVMGEKYFLYYKYEKIKLNYTQWKYLEKNHDRQNEYYFPFQTFVQSLKFHIPNRSKTYGYVPLKHKKFNLYKPGGIAKQLFEPLALFPISEYEVQYIARLKKEVEKNGAKFIFVLTPTYSWSNYYPKEAAEYDTQLIALLNKYIKKGIVIGSFYADDYGLGYEDFKDDTHLAHSGALKFTKKIFNDIKILEKLQPKTFKYTFTYKYRHDKTYKNANIENCKKFSSVLK